MNKRVKHEVYHRSPFEEYEVKSAFSSLEQVPGRYRRSLSIDKLHVTEANSGAMVRIAERSSMSKFHKNLVK